MSGGKGGSTTTTVKVPKFLETAAKRNLTRADEIAKIGYVPYYGPDVAALTPMQQAAMANTNAASEAFGLSAPQDAMAGMPQAQTFAGGVQGYASAPMYQGSLEQLRATNPAQYAAITSMFVNPKTGAAPRAPFATPVAAPNTGLPPAARNTGGRSSSAAAMSAAARSNTGGGGQWNGWGNGSGPITDTYDPYNDPNVVGVFPAAKNAASGVAARAANSMGSGK